MSQRTGPDDLHPGMFVRYVLPGIPGRPGTPRPALVVRVRADGTATLSVFVDQRADYQADPLIQVSGVAYDAAGSVGTWHVLAEDATGGDV